jgi:hypothetical protein
MIDKLELYDILGTVVPGVLLAYWLPICFPDIVAMVSAVRFPESIAVIGFSAVAILFGQLVQALASALEWLLFLSWGGKPSERALSNGLGDRYLSKSTGTRIRRCLAPLAAGGASDQDLFYIAQSRAYATSGSRLSQLNAFYAYHRGLVVVLVLGMLILITSRQWGEAAAWRTEVFWSSISILAVTLVMMWYRAKQRAYYFVREALRVAERTMVGGEALHE